MGISSHKAKEERIKARADAAKRFLDISLPLNKLDGYFFGTHFPVNN
jgi:hypothetical protein